MSIVHTFFTQLKASGAKEALPRPATAGEAASATSPATDSFHVAVQGCCHGELSRIYDACALHEQQTGKKIDVLVCCGDFQAIRTYADLQSMAVPEKFKVLGDFHHYYSAGTSAGRTTAHGSARSAPYLTIFIGGNHENSDWLAEESYGGFVAPNIYYLGHSGVIEVDGLLTIAGLSGIFKGQDYHRPYPKRPYWENESCKRSAYHVRRIEVEKLRAFASILEGERRCTGTGEPSPTYPPSLVDLVVSHDWPVGITAYGNEEQLLRYKPYFRDDIAHKALGNPHTLALLHCFRPQYWLSAHLHCYFEACVPHRNYTPPSGRVHYGPPPSTKFIALDKCAKRTGFLDFIDVPVRSTTEKATRCVKPCHMNEESFLGASRIRRNRQWVRVLQASHNFLTDNRCLDRERGVLDGFCAEEVAERFPAQPSTTTSAKTEGEVGSSICATLNTANLLTALGLNPAPLLQTPMGPPPQNQRRDLSSRGHQPYQESVSHGLPYECSQPPKEEVGQVPQEAPLPWIAVTAPASEVDERMQPLMWSEDVGRE